MNITRTAVLKNQAESFDKTIAEQKENMLKIEKERDELRSIISKLEQDKERIVEAQQNMSNYVASIKDSYSLEIKDLIEKNLKLQTNEKELQRLIECQQYLHNKLQNGIQEKTFSNEAIRRISRRKTTLPINSNVTD